MTSSTCILHLRSGQDLVSKMAAQILGRTQVHLGLAKQLGQIGLHGCESKETWDTAGQKVD